MFQLHLQVQTIHPEKGVRISRAWVSKSFVKNFLWLLYRNMAAASSDPMDIDGNTRNYTSSVTSPLHLPQATGNGRVFTYDHTADKTFGDRVGILVGTGSAANTALTYCLHQQLRHVADDFEYMGGVISEVTVSGSDAYFDIERIFRNVSGGQYTITEYGLSVLHGNDTSYKYPFLIVRDVFTNPVDYVYVADGEFLKVTYRLLVTV